jgi:hypothetical protein
MKQLFFFLSFSYTVNCLAQSRSEKITYIFSDTVEITLDSVLNSLSKNTNDVLFFLYLRKDSSNFNASVVSYRKKEEKNLSRLVKQTNRFAIINQRLVPVIFDYDYLFTSPSNDIGSFGHRDNQIVRSRLLTHGPVIIFSARGNLVHYRNN